MKTVFKIAAGLLIVCSGAWLILQASGSGSLAFADVLAATRNAQSVRFAITTSSGQPLKAVTGTMLCLDDGRTRGESPDAASITDFRQKKTLVLMPKLKMATLMEYEHLPEKVLSLNLLEHMRQMDAKAAQDAKPMGQKQLEGRSVEGFELPPKDGRREIVWVDRETRLPVQIQMTSAGGGESLFSDFVWNPPFDEALFSLTIPEGYQLRRSTLDVSMPTEKDLVASLGLWAEMNEGRFPDSFSVGDMPKLFKLPAPTQVGEIAPAPFKMPTIAEQQEHGRKTRLISRGHVFIMLGEGSDWHYAGKGIALNSGDTPIFWYKPKNSPSYRVISADLSVRDLAADHLPAVPSVVLDPARIMTLPTTMPR